VVGANVRSVGGYDTPEKVVARALQELDRARPRASVVPGVVNAVGARLVGVLPRRLALTVSGRVV
jgi:hypothetical protein